MMNDAADVLSIAVDISKQLIDAHISNAQNKMEADYKPQKV